MLVWSCNTDSFSFIDSHYNCFSDYTSASPCVRDRIFVQYLMTSRSKLKGLLRKHQESYEDSVDQRTLPIVPTADDWPQNQKCWYPTGPLASEFEEVYPGLRDVVNRSCGNTGGEVSIDLFMVGKTPKKAKPIIILSSTCTQSRQSGRTDIESSGILDHTAFSLGDMRFSPPGPLVLVAKEEELGSRTLLTALPRRVLFDPLDKIRLIGMPILIERIEGPARQATGNIVYNGSQFGYITAAHALYETTPDILATDNEESINIPFDNDSDSDMEGYAEGGEDSLSRHSDTSAEMVETDSSSPWSPRTLPSRSSSLGLSKVTSPLSPGHGTPQAESSVGFDKTADDASLDQVYHPLGTITTVIIPALDCMIIAVTDSKVIDELERLMEAEIKPEYETEATDFDSKEVTAWTSHNPIKGRLLGTPSLMRFAESKSYEQVYRFILGEVGAIKQGDCGTLVTDPLCRVPYGQVIAVSENEKMAYMVAAQPIMQKLDEAGKWRLLGVSSNLGESHPPVTP